MFVLCVLKFCVHIIGAMQCKYISIRKVSKWLFWRKDGFDLFQRQVASGCSKSLEHKHIHSLI